MAGKTKIGRPKGTGAGLDVKLFSRFTKGTEKAIKRVAKHEGVETSTALRMLVLEALAARGEKT